MKNLVKTNLVALLLSAVSLQASAQTAQFECRGHNERVQVSLDDSGNLTFDDKSTPEKADRFNCLPKGQGGELYFGGEGPNSWGYRVPTNVSSDTNHFKMQFAWDEDSDGMACDYTVLRCQRQ